MQSDENASEDRVLCAYDNSNLSNVFFISAHVYFSIQVFECINKISFLIFSWKFQNAMQQQRQKNK